MKALELRSMFSGVAYDNEKALQIHKERLKSTQKTVDNSEPLSLSARCSSPSKKYVSKSAMRDSIMKENLLLARRIFNIMEGTSSITDKINDTKHLDNHPGTMNFKHRLQEAQRIHNRNMVLASRLDTIQPYYKTSDLCVVRTVKAKSPKVKQSKKSRFAKEFETIVNSVDRDRADTAPTLTARSEGGVPPEKFLDGFKFASTPVSQHHPRSARKSGESEYSSRGGGSTSAPRSHNVLLEYTKIQDGHCLDVAVLKEPFRDRYAIFGIDVDDGRRYELRLSSDDVSSILDGDILVTSVDNVEVWMALLNKVSLLPVQEFTKLPFTADEVDSLVSREGDPASSSANNLATQPPLVASRPTSERPSSRAAGGRKLVSRDTPQTEPVPSEPLNKIPQVPTSDFLNKYNVPELPLNGVRPAADDANTGDNDKQQPRSGRDGGAIVSARRDPKPAEAPVAAKKSPRLAAVGFSRSAVPPKRVQPAASLEAGKSSAVRKDNAVRAHKVSANTSQGVSPNKTPAKSPASQRNPAKSATNSNKVIALQALANETFVADAVRSAIEKVAAVAQRK